MSRYTVDGGHGGSFGVLFGAFLRSFSTLKIMLFLKPFPVTVFDDFGGDLGAKRSSILNKKAIRERKCDFSKT